MARVSGTGTGAQPSVEDSAVGDYSGGPAIVMKCVCFASFSEPLQLFRDVYELWCMCMCSIWRPCELAIVSRKVAYCLYPGPVRISEEFFQTMDLLGICLFLRKLFS